MKNRQLPPGHRAVTPGQVVRWGLVIVVLLSVIGINFFSNTSSTTGPLPAARPTSPAEAALNNPKAELPRTKEEAAAFERVYHSLYNFDRLRALNSAYDRGDKAALESMAQGGPLVIAAANATPGSNLPATPAPTSSGRFSSSNQTPTPTGTGDSFRSNGSSNCAGSNPGTTVVDACENDDSAGIAAPIAANDVAQGHNFVPNAGATSDADWLIFQVPTAYVPYTINLNVLPPTAALPLVALFDSTASNVISTGVSVAAGNVVISNFVPTVGGSYYIRVLPASGTVTAMDTYQIRLTTGTAVPTPTGTTTSTVTGGPTNTPVPCRDEFEDDNSPANAKLLRPSFSDQPPFGGTPAAPAIPVENSAVQTHFICPEADVDWVYMDLVKGKPYSVFTSGLTNGLDTFMVLYIKDSAGNLVPLYSSDDYPGMGIASRIDWVVPTTADTPLGQFVRYYLAVKDVAGHGVLNLKYNLILSTPGNGLGDCFDQYEPNNNPLQAKDILINEVQNHSFCPTGDRDWLRFFAKAGRLYNISTTFPPTAAGLDTSVYIYQVFFDQADPGKIVDQKLLGQNDDRSDSDLSSSANFSVPNDGYYYAEIRNSGDIGRNGLYYSVRYTNAGSTPLPSPTVGPTRTSATTATVAPATATATKANVTAASVAAEIQSLAAKLRFSDPGFQRLWLYSDLAVAAGKVQRSWEWGPNPAASKLENYAEATGGSRQVQYFDKARMEINNPKGNHDSPWFVTNGLLVKEMVTGWLATGDNQGELRLAAKLPVAGDLSDSNVAPAYASFLNLITQNQSNRDENRTGQPVTAGLAKDGTVSTLKTPPEQLKLEAYIKETGHNIPGLFWSFLNSQGLVYEGSDYKPGQVRDWVFSMGLPLSEPYWIKASVNGNEQDVLVQLYERRVLTYTPSNPADWRIEMANVGAHYYQWRYNARLE